MIAPTGQQFVLTRGSSRAVIASLAASLREFTIDGVDISQPYSEHTLPPFACGIVLVPWPNRVRDGQWVLQGKTQQLDITEADKHNAIHGLLRNTAYDLVERTDSSVTLAATVHPQHGYPFYLETTVTYELVDDGLAVTHGIRNRSEDSAPVAIGTHPFLTIGDVPTEDLTLTVHASSRFEVDERLNLIQQSSVEGTSRDLREPRRIGDLELDDNFGGVTTVDGVSATLTAPDGRTVSLVQDENFPYVQVFITPIFPKADGLGYAVAIEPMTAPVGALDTGESLRWLAKDESWSATWGIRYSGAHEGE